MLRMTYRSLTMLVKNALTNPSCGGARHGGGLLPIPRRRREGHAPRLAHGFGDRRHKTACNTRILTGQTLGIFHPDEGASVFLFCKGFEHMVNKPFFLRGQRAPALPWTCQGQICISHLRTN